MQSLSLTAARYAIRLIISFLAIAFVLATASIGYNAYKAHQSSDTEVATLQGARKDLDRWRRSAESETSNRVAVLQSASREALDRRIVEIDASMAVPATPGAFTRILQDPSTSAVSAALLNSIAHDAKVGLLKREREIVVQLRDFKAGEHELQRTHFAFLAADAAQKQNQYLQLALLRDHPVLARTPWTAQHTELARLEQVYAASADLTQQAQQAYDLQRAATMALGLPVHMAERVALAVDGAQGQLDAHIGIRERDMARSWIDTAIREFKRVGGAAAWILVALILTPIAIKVVFYYVLAPLAARRPPICLLPDASGALEGLPENALRPPFRACVSSISLPLSIGPADVLLVHPDFLQSSGAGARMGTQWLLDWKYPFASLAAGMRMLTRIEAQQDGVVVISATRDPLTEVGVLALPRGGSFVLQPRNLVGALHPANTPLRITSEWRVWSLHAWLTLQMRYLVFHGPAQLVVKGCRGVRVESADVPRRINQAATIGWSANLQYMTTRSETFAAYLFGQRELLNDSFAGADGYFVYEEVPDRRRAGGILGRGLEGMTDAALKVFGI